MYTLSCRCRLQSHCRSAGGSSAKGVLIALDASLIFGSVVLFCFSAIPTLILSEYDIMRDNGRLSVEGRYQHQWVSEFVPHSRFLDADFEIF